MSYIALARKWRPRTFSQLIGQNHITKALVNALHQQRLHHAYLFTGTRGVGKTSIARLLAKALNCLQGIQSEPCLQCEACLAIEQGQFIDLIEIDGASRTRVEDTREILENVQYAPTNARFKIYLIDEVHMLSQHSFNALLKTLEEPPAHVKFILATTDPQKLPITVLSRCLQFNLKTVPIATISQHLQSILDAEQIAYETAILDLLAKAAQGSVRDALSLLDQAIAGSSQQITVSDVKNCLGYTQQDYAHQLLAALAELAPQKLIAISQQIAEEGGHFRYVLDEILNYFHQLSICQLLPNSTYSDQSVQALSTQFTAEDVQLFYQIGLKGLEDLAFAPTTQIGFEMTLLRMHTFRPVSCKKMPALMHQNPSPQKTNEPATLQTIAEHMTPILIPQEKEPPAPPSETVNEKNKVNLAWNELLPHLHLTGLALNAAENSELVSQTDHNVVLRVAKGHHSLFTPTVRTRITEALSNYYCAKIKLTINSEETLASSPAQQKIITKEKQHDEAQQALQSDPFFQQLQHEFSAELVKNSIAQRKDNL